MKLAYVDTSCLVALAVGKGAAEQVAMRLRAFDGLVASALLEAEYRVTLAREGIALPPDPFRDLQWVFPPRRLTAELDRALAAGHARGADLWHLACALFFRSRVERLAFLTLDQRQRELADTLGFAT